ncbi:ferritin [Persicirhabdus sediminis]|uniref:Ferritin n=1 Tax=Persicirhabdus sediminis TaxID=454144 RepID=A0A8J7MCY3_9BACT|nr:ferritin [Persicirhabdus sediminis]MBK1790276.1 ferritin [Persicirhabdus sediminis]
MIDDKLAAAINSQINQEFSAAWSYLAMSLWLDEQNLDGFSSWMRLQHQEEQAHGTKLLNYLLDRGGIIKLDAIPQPTNEFASPLDVFEKSLLMERDNTNSINELYELATQLNDHATKSHLQWFLDEQVEEEKSFEDVIALLKKVGDDITGLLYLDDKMAARSAEDHDDDSA